MDRLKRSISSSRHRAAAARQLQARRAARASCACGDGSIGCHCSSTMPSTCIGVVWACKRVQQRLQLLADDRVVGEDHRDGVDAARRSRPPGRRALRVLRPGPCARPAARSASMPAGGHRPQGGLAPPGRRRFEQSIARLLAERLLGLARAPCARSTRCRPRPRPRTPRLRPADRVEAHSRTALLSVFICVHLWPLRRLLACELHRRLDVHFHDT